ncbi:MAG: M48 family metalloprotease [Gammaproteobacteria bacterium]
MPYIKKTLFILYILLISPSLPAQNLELPSIGDSVATGMSPEQERRTGESVIRNIRRAGGILDDPLTTEYINQLGYQLVSHSRAEHKDFAFFIINDAQINAFALPGGFIGINYGLILSSQSESELASVVAHEIAHITQRHHARAYNLAEESNIPVMAALIAAIVLGSENNEVGEAAMASLAAGTAQKQIDFTRENEKEADHIGIALLAESGYDPYSMADFFDTLQNRSRLYGPQAPEFLRTHPVSKNRTADAKNRAASYPRASLKNEFDFHLIRSRLKVLTSQNPKQILLQFEENLKSGRYADKTAEQYGYALALLENNMHQKAANIIQRLVKSDPQRIAYQLAHARERQLAGDTKSALRIYENALSIYPNNEALTLQYVETLLANRRPKAAIEILNKILRNTPATPAFYKLLAQAEGQLNHSTNRHIAQAEYYYHIGQIHQALTQLKIALKDKNANFYQRSRIEARQKQFQQEILESSDQ